MENYLSHSILEFFHKLPLKLALDEEINLLNPYQQASVRDVTRQFYNRFYSDSRERIFILGINPGRFGSGITGIAFTDPIRLKEILSIDHDFSNKPELSSIFIYDLIRECGGAEKFYSAFYINSVCPLGFTKHGKNMNYYDDRILLESVKPFIIENLHKQIEFGLSKNVAFCLGEGKNYEFLNKLNKTEAFFKEIIPLPHPRYIMQYKTKNKDEYIKKIVIQLHAALKQSQTFG